MIRVRKPEQAPRILRERGQRTTEANQQAFENGERTFKFDSPIYRAKSVKNALIKAQHDKCAFCESKVGHIAYGDVEHYRPKGGVRQIDSDPLEQPGYFWLAYDWANLFFACQLCNQSFKRNLFPLADPTRRARSHNDDMAAEQPMLIQPEDEEPTAFIGFREEIAFPIDDDPRARITIEVVGLNTAKPWPSNVWIASSLIDCFARGCSSYRGMMRKRGRFGHYLRTLFFRRHSIPACCGRSWVTHPIQPNPCDVAGVRLRMRGERPAHPPLSSMEARLCGAALTRSC